MLIVLSDVLADILSDWSVVFLNVWQERDVFDNGSEEKQFPVSSSRG